MTEVREADGRQTEKLGYLGLGMMGFPMTRRLLEAGYEVAVWNRSAGKAAALVEAGAKPAANPREMATTATIIFMCVTDAAAVEEVVFGPDGLAASSRRWKTGRRFLIDPSRQSARDRRAPQGCERHGMGRCAGLGRHQGGEEGTLAVMAGGDAADIERVRPYVLAMARRLTHMGPTGAGQTTKLCNQVIVGCAMAVLAEATRLADKRRDRRRTAAGSLGRRLCRFHSPATIRAAHGAGHSLAAARPYRDHAEGPRHGGRRRPQYVEPGADGRPCRAIIQAGQGSARCGRRRARDLQAVGLADRLRQPARNFATAEKSVRNTFDKA